MEIPEHLLVRAKKAREQAAELGREMISTITNATVPKVSKVQANLNGYMDEAGRIINKVNQCELNDWEDTTRGERIAMKEARTQAKRVLELVEALREVKAN